MLVELSDKFQPVSQLQYQFFLDTTILFQRDFIYIKQHRNVRNGYTEHHTTLYFLSIIIDRIIIIFPDKFVIVKIRTR